MTDLSQCQYDPNKDCPNALLASVTLRNMSKSIDQAKKETSEFQSDMRQEIKDIHHRMDALTKWIVLLIFANLTAVIGFIVSLADK